MVLRKRFKRKIDQNNGKKREKPRCGATERFTHAKATNVKSRKIVL